MDEKYIRDLEAAYDLSIDKINTLENQKEQAENSLNANQEYLKDVIYCLADKLKESDRWDVLQDISKIGKRKVYHDNQNADIIVSLVSERLGFTREAVIKY